MLSKILNDIRKIVPYIYEHFKEAQLQTMASSLGFITLLSIVPLFGIAFSFFGHSEYLHRYYLEAEPLIFKYLNATTSAEIANVIQAVVDQLKSVEIGLTSAVVFLLSSSRLIHEIDQSFQRIWKIKRRRAIWQRVFIYWFVVFALPIGSMLIFSVMTHFQIISGSSVVYFINIGLGLGFYLIYRFVPPERIRNRIAMIGSFLAISTLVLSQKVFFSVMVTVFSSQKVYGSFISIPIFLIYVYIIWVIFLAGAIFCAGAQKGFNS